VGHSRFRYRPPASVDQEGISEARRADLYLLYDSNQDTIFEWYDFLKYDLRPDKVNFNYDCPPSADPVELDIDHSRYKKLAGMIDDDSRHGRDQKQLWRHMPLLKAAIDIYMHDLIAKTQETQKAQMKCYPAPLVE